MKVIGIVGTRRKDSITDFLKVQTKFFEIYEEGDEICSGLCSRGADRFATILAKNNNIKSIWYPADWKRFGRGAGFVRNTDIAKTSDVLIALVADDRTGGTEDTVKKFVGFHGEKNLHILY